MSRDGPALQPGTRSYARTLDTRRRDDGRRAAAPGRDRRGARVRRLVRRPHLRHRARCRAASTSAAPTRWPRTTATASTCTRSPRSGATRATTAGSPRHWPQVQRVLAWQEALRQSERGARNRDAGTRAPVRPDAAVDQPRGLLGQAGATPTGTTSGRCAATRTRCVIAQALGHADDARTLVAAGATSSSRELCGVDRGDRDACTASTVVAGAADRGDFDPTSTTIALNPAQADAAARPARGDLRALLAASRRHAPQGRVAWKDYTPYELRNVGALVRLGQRERAHAMLRLLLRATSAPRPGTSGPRSCCPTPREPRFLGDMPHAWVASDYIRSALDLFAYERESDGAIVIGAGFTADWLAHPLDGQRAVDRRRPARLQPASAARRLAAGSAARRSPRRCGCRGRPDCRCPTRCTATVRSPGTVTSCRCRRRRLSSTCGDDVDERRSNRHWHTLRSDSGLWCELFATARSGGCGHGDDVLNLFVGNAVEGGPAALWLRRIATTAASSRHATARPGERRSMAVGQRPRQRRRRGGAGDVQLAHRAAARAASAPAWFWHLQVDNTGRRGRDGRRHPGARHRADELRRVAAQRTLRQPLRRPAAAAACRPRLGRRGAAEPRRRTRARAPPVGRDRVAARRA